MFERNTRCLQTHRVHTLVRAAGEAIGTNTKQVRVARYYEASSLATNSPLAAAIQSWFQEGRSKEEFGPATCPDARQSQSHAYHWMWVRSRLVTVARGCRDQKATPRFLSIERRTYKSTRVVPEGLGKLRMTESTYINCWRSCST